MQLLLKLAQNSRTIITTIHQPRSSIFGLFDDLLLLSEGRCIYSGASRSALGYFSQRGFHCPENFNPADYYMDLLSVDIRSQALEKRTRRRVAKLADGYIATTPISRSLLTTSDTANVVKEPSEETLTKYASSWATQFYHLSARSLRSAVREKKNNIAVLIQTIIFSLLLGCIWRGIGGDKSGVTVNASAGVLFFIVVNQSFMGLFGIIFMFPSERAIIFKERASRTYHVGAYFWSKTAAEMPKMLLVSLLFGVIVYTMVGLRAGAGSFFSFYIAIVLVQLCAEGIAFCISAVAKDAQGAAAIAPAFMVTAMLFGGFFIGANQMPVWIGWLKHLSPIKYGFNALMQVEYNDRSLDISSCIPNAFCPRTGEEVLNFFQLHEVPLYANFVILISFALGLRFIAYVLLLRNGPKYDRSI